VSKYLMGFQDYDAELRQMIMKEVTENKQFYLDRLVNRHVDLFKEDSDLSDEAKKEERKNQLWEELKASCEGKAGRGPWAGLDEVFVLANAIKRPIIVYADAKSVAMHGESLMGVGGAFLPLRHKPEDCVSKSPILIAWSNVGFHFCALVHLPDWNETKFEFPVVRPVAVKQLSLSLLEPSPAEGELSPEESAEIAKYIDYWEELKPPPVWRDHVITIHNNNPIEGFPKVVNPKDGEMYDIVIPVDFGMKVDYLAFNLGDEELSTKISKMVEDNYHHMMDSEYYAVHYKDKIMDNCNALADYIDNRLQTIRRRFLHCKQHSMFVAAAAASASAGDCANTGEVFRIYDFIPKHLEPSYPCPSEQIHFVAASIDREPRIPFPVPCRFTEKPSDRTTDEILQAAMRDLGSESNTFVDYLLACNQAMDSFLAPSASPSPASSPMENLPDARYMRYLIQVIQVMKGLTFPKFDLFRYYALHPYIVYYLCCNFQWFRVPKENEPFCVHVAFIKLMANLVSTTCSSKLEPGLDFDMMNELYQHGFFTNYLRSASKSLSPDLLLPLSVLFLNIAVMGHFSPFNVFIARQYPRLLLAALRLKNKPLLHNVLFGLGTVIYNDHAALMALVSCPPILTILAEVKEFDPEFAVYADFCSSCIEEERNSAEEKEEEEKKKKEEKKDEAEKKKEEETK